MTWEPQIDLVVDSDDIRVSASDAASTCECGRYLALKVRRDVRSPVWQPRRPPWGEGVPFMLGIVKDIVIAAHAVPDKTGTYEDLTEWLHETIERMNVHRLLRVYVAQAVENILDVHDAIESEIGSLRLIKFWPEIGSNDRILNVWAPLYETEAGLREVRRIRIRSAHGPADDEDENEDDQAWAIAAARVALRYRNRDRHVRRVRVVEIGAADGTHSVPFEGTPEQIEAAYDKRVKPRIMSLIAADHVVPCRDCGKCKVAGVCDGLIPVAGMLGQTERGLMTRSVSPSSLDQYRRCPGQWLLMELHVPREAGVGEAQLRGQRVHQWLKRAHGRGRACTRDDLPAPGAGLGLAAGQLTEDEYASIHAYLRHHIDGCGLADDDVELLAADENVYGFDGDADLVPVTRPDLIFRRGDELVIREVKTIETGPPPDRDAAFDRYLQISFTLQLLSAGLVARHGGTAGTVELEILTPTGRDLWRWATTEGPMMRQAAGIVRRVTAPWHRDTAWETTPGPHCSWCPVRVWCPDRDLYALDSVSRGPRGAAREEADEEPPF